MHVSCRSPASSIGQCRCCAKLNVLINAIDAMRDAGHVLAGSAATVRDTLRQFVAAIGRKHNYLCGAFQWGDLTTGEARRSLDLFAAEVMPALR